MTVQAGVEVDVDLELVVGEFEQLACEHPQHASRQGTAHDGGPAKFYARGTCPACMFFGEIRAVCAGYASLAKTEHPMRCLSCNHIGPAREMTQVLAPIK
jgi:hypothetical protein